MHRNLVLAVAAALVVSIGSVAAVLACPLCGAVQQTLSEEMASMDVVVIAHLKEPPPPIDESADSDLNARVATAKFEVVKTLKGADVLAGQKIIETPYFGDGKKGQSFMIMGVDPPKLLWSPPLILSVRAESYLPKLLELPAEGPDRLAFFQDFLEDGDEMLARDAYDEIAKAPYKAISEIKDRMKKEQLVGWIQNRDIPAARKRLYFMMLGVCGSKAELPMLEELLRSDDRQAKAGLDSMIACYVTLAGENGLPLIEELYLANKEAEYADTYAAIMAIRFHGTDGNVVPQKRLVTALRHMLDRPQLADLVIPDLARWEDWEAMPRLVELFKTADEKSSWVRVPVINYLRACPLPEAKKYMAELEKLDPAAVRRANSFFPFLPSSGGDAKSSDTEKKTSSLDNNLIYPVSYRGDGPNKEASPVIAQDLAPKRANYSLPATVGLVVVISLSITAWRVRK